jgi:hypothetical protein
MANQVVSDNLRFIGWSVTGLGCLGIIGTMLFWDQRGPLGSTSRLLLALGFIVLGYVAVRLSANRLRQPRKN